MNLEKTVFILGAGASVPYGYPTGYDLRNDIINKYDGVLNDSFKAFGPNGNTLENFKYIIKPIIKDFDESNTDSIDLFLTRSENERTIGYGTNLIWLFINWYEMQSSPKLRASNSNEDWYFAFYNELISNIPYKAALKNISNDYITFITFNYDRSFENFLFSSFLKSFPINDLETTQLLNEKFNIHHVYGKIINLPWENGLPKSDYRSEASLNKFAVSSSNIKLIYNKRKTIPDETQSFLQDAKKIFCLGFGFADINLEILNLHKLLNPATEIYATSRGLDAAKQNHINELLRNNRPEMEKWSIKFENCGSLELLRKHLF
jgi:hypothetical protein